MRVIELAGVMVTLHLAGSARPAGAQATVLPAAETAPVPSSGDAADDSVVWVHPTDPALSTVIGTDKSSGLLVYDLAGNVLQYLPDGELNNVDLRQGFPLGGGEVALVASGERGADRLAVYAVDPATRTLRDVVARVIPLGYDVYGCCMYRSAATGDTYFFCTSEDGDVQQWRLFDAGNGKVDAALVRAFSVGDTAEGCVADDDLGYLFVSEEDQGIWRYGAEPGAGIAGVLVDHTGHGGHLKADVEGLAVYRARSGAGYLIASSQGDSTYVVYDRTPPHAHRLTFQIGAHAALGIDGVTDTDGIEVTNQSLGSAFPGGLFVVQDGANDGTNQNFKLVSWPAIAAAATPPLIVDPGSGEHGGRPCRRSEVLFRNGSGVNPLTLVSRGLPDLGSPWACDLGCTGHAPGLGILWAYERPAVGPLVAVGELLVDPTSPRLFRLSAPHAGGTVRFVAPVPVDPVLCGRTAALQGLCQGAPGPQLSNALDLLLGL